MRSISGARWGNQPFQASLRTGVALASVVAVEHRKRDIDVGLAARRVEHAPAPRPVFDGGGAVGGSRSSAVLAISRRVAAVDQILAHRHQAEPVAQHRIAAVGGDDQVGADASGRPPARVRRRPSPPLPPSPVTISAPDALRRRRQRVDDGLAHDAEHPAADPAMHRDHPVAVVAHLAGMGEGRAFHRRVVGAHRREHAQPVLIDIDACAGCAQALPALVHAHAPAALRQRAGRREAGETCAHDLRVSFFHRII